MSKGNRLVLLPFDRQIRYGTGVRYEFDETTTVGLSYEYLDLGSGKLTNRSRARRSRVSTAATTCSPSR